MLPCRCKALEQQAVERSGVAGGGGYSLAEIMISQVGVHSNAVF